jgi:alginate O-acetyltransferase complex protein AlgI
MLEFLPLPILWLFFYALGRLSRGGSLSLRHYLLTAASLFILLGSAGPVTFAFFAAAGLAIVLLGVWLQRLLESRFRKIVFFLAITAVVVLIAVFLSFRVYFQKYFVSLPSLSYLGFRGIAYLVSAYRGRSISFSSGLLQMFFLPMLFMGPISRVENFQQESRDDREVLRRLAMAFPMLIAGHLIGKLVLEKVLSLNDVACWEFWVGAVANSFQFYFTFAGYSHLIIGLGLVAGFKLPENFNNPYIATSIGDFWRRWHMSLSFWIRDYLYIPLGGNRRGIARKCTNLLVAMGICGIWHGIEMHYLLWGLFHGALLAIESVMRERDWRPMERRCGRLYRPLKLVIVFSLVTFGWLLFKYPMNEFYAYLRGMSPW